MTCIAGMLEHQGDQNPCKTSASRGQCQVDTEAPCLLSRPADDQKATEAHPGSTETRAASTHTHTPGRRGEMGGLREPAPPWWGDVGGVKAPATPPAACTHQHTAPCFKMCCFRLLCAIKLLCHAHGSGDDQACNLSASSHH